MYTIRFFCTQHLHNLHDSDVSLGHLIIYGMPSCCNHKMEPVDAFEWTRITKIIAHMNDDLQRAGLPDLRTLLTEDI